MINARKSIYILAWDLSERIEMIRNEEDEDGFPSKPADFIYVLLEKNPDLEIFILLWDYSVVYLAEREWIPFTQWRKKGHPRLHFRMDNALPVGASHHQKIVVIDETVAFCGGFDLSAWRWDTREHQAEESRRKTPAGELYQPYHDIQMILEGKVVDDLSDLCAMRWKRATGEELPGINEKPDRSPWPDDLSTDFTEGEGILALTFSKYKDFPPASHNERLYIDLIEAAEKYIYIENQYLSSHTLVKALAERLGEKAGPEIIIVLTRDTGGWMEEGTMGLLRNRLLGILREADRHNRFSALYPHVRDDSGNESQVYVHAKLMIVDDQGIRVGSSNLSNRSMKVDSEVDLGILNDEPKEYVRDLLYRLLAIHFRSEEEEIRKILGQSGSIGEGIRQLREGKDHCLRDIRVDKQPAILKMLADTQILDPDEPIGPGYWIRETVERMDPEKDKVKWLPLVMKWGLALVILAGLAYGLKVGWSNVVTKESAIAFIEGIRASDWALPTLFGSFLVAGLVAIPINLLLIAGTIVMGPWITFACGLGGSLASAVVAFGLGHGAGKPLVRRIAGDKLNKLSGLSDNRGILSVAMIRILPVAPFPVINLAAGASGLRFRAFLYGSILGMFPGMLGVVWVTHQFEAVILNPGIKSILVLLAVVLIVIGTGLYLRKRLKQ